MFTFGLNAVTLDLTARSQVAPDASRLEGTEDMVFHDLGTLHVTGALSGYDGNATDAKAALMAASRIARRSNGTMPGWSTGPWQRPPRR